jgi:hypothetical protein
MLYMVKVRLILRMVDLMRMELLALEPRDLDLNPPLVFVDTLPLHSITSMLKPLRLRTRTNKSSNSK